MNNKQRKRAIKKKLIKRLINGSLRRSSNTQHGVVSNMKRKNECMVAIFNGYHEGILLDNEKINFTVSSLKVKKII